MTSEGPKSDRHSSGEATRAQPQASVAAPSGGGPPEGGLSDTEQAWERVAEQIDAVIARWEACLAGEGEPPELAEYLTGAAEVDQIALPELIKVDLEHRWSNAREPKKLEAYAAELPQLGPVEALPVELIYEELQVRMQAGDAVNERELSQRFPERAAALQQMVGGMAVTGSPTEIYFGSTLAGPPGAGPTGDGPAHVSDVRLADDKPYDHLKPGDVLDDFELMLPLGSGAFAKVFLARQVSMERLVALKISAHTGSEPQTLAQLDHPNIVRVFDQRIADDPQARLLYMEVVPGGTLGDLLTALKNTPAKQRTGRLVIDVVDAKLGSRGQAPPEGSAQRRWFKEASWPLAVCEIGAQLAEGLAYAHEKGVMHRDVKPANVLLGAKGSPKLADFNISFNGGRVGEDPADTFGGSLAYMSPEQLEACHPLLGGSPRMVREASDIYSVGVMLWELLTGERPFQDEATKIGSLAGLQRMIDARRTADLNELCKKLPTDCPDSLRQVLVRCLQPVKADRYEDAQQLASALRLCLDPTSWKLMQEPQGGFAGVALLLPLLWVVVASMVPNILAGIFNYHYNEAWLVQQVPELHTRFEKVQLVINALVFPVSMFIGVGRARKVAKMLWSDDPRKVGEGAHHALHFGRFVALLSMVMWTGAGLAFPIAINWGVPIESQFGFYTHFVLSLVLCGCIGAAYPYFLVTTLAVHSFIPALMRNNATTCPQPSDVRSVRFWNRFFLALATLVPMLGVWLVVAYGDTQKVYLMIASGVGMLGFLGMYALDRLIEDDLTSLQRLSSESRFTSSWS